MANLCHLRLRCEWEEESVHEKQRKNAVFFLFKLKPLIEMIFGWDFGVIYGDRRKMYFYSTTQQIESFFFGSDELLMEARIIPKDRFICSVRRIDLGDFVVFILRDSFRSSYHHANDSVPVCHFIFHSEAILFRCHLFCEMKTEIRFFFLIFCVSSLTRRYK